MTDSARDACITGIGIVSCLGEGPDAHWDKLMRGETHVDDTTFAPYSVHPVVPLDYDKQIPKKGDQRQMEAWQRIGTYAAGLALDSAGIKGNADVLARTDMIVAAGGGERDLAADSAILTAMKDAADPDSVLNARLMSDIRPTLFLAQLSNLLAGNISIVHGVTGSSRTFMGEEAAGVDAVRIACSRINAGQSEVALVGGSYNGERKDSIMLFEFGNLLLEGGYAPVWERASGGAALGSLGAFLVIESRAHAQARGAKVHGRIAEVLSERAKPDQLADASALRSLWERIGGSVRKGEAAMLSAATGVAPATAAERAFLAAIPDLPVRATETYIGHSNEAQFTMNLALAAIALGHGTLFPPKDGTGLEKPMSAPLKQVVVSSVGLWRGAGMALVEAP
ncbi:MAG: beta-ketoacyl-ACP synthase [Xanthobacteraceae bacterium]|uniref:beta-ketoacyl-ACP synthase n=1 Tax=Pseudolabrys sp. TaxID=1960880 RepID=UPI003D0C3D12